MVLLSPVGVQLIFGSHLTEKACCEGAVRRRSSSTSLHLCLGQWPRSECPILDPHQSLSVDAVMLHLYPISSQSSSQPDNLGFCFDLEPFSWLWTGWVFSELLADPGYHHWADLDPETLTFFPGSISGKLLPVPAL